MVRDIVSRLHNCEAFWIAVAVGLVLAPAAIGWGLASAGVPIGGTDGMEWGAR